MPRRIGAVELGALGLAALSLAAPAYASLTIEPAEISLTGPGASQRLLLTETAADGRARDVSKTCRVRSDAPGVVRVEEGKAVAAAPGTATLRADCEGASASISVEVGNQAPGDMQIDFARDLLSIFTTKGCNGSSCHGSPRARPASNFRSTARTLQLTTR
ncbi:MAG: hypothetical protein R2748_11595 [Bryobacterales bacterium]